MEDTYKKCINARLKELAQKRKIKDDAVLMCSFILGSDKEFFDGLSKIEMHEFFHNVTDFFEERYGTENILSAVVHLDETTPHMHLNLIHVFEGRLCAKKLFDRVELRELQSDFHEKVGKKWGLKRGKIGSTAKHLETTEFKAKKIIEGAEQQAEETKKQARLQAEEIKAEAAPYHEALAQALNGNYAWTPGGLKKQAIAATAETIKTKKENEDLTRRLDTSMSETLHYAKKADAAEQREAKGNRAIELLAKLQRENPEAFEKLLHPTPKPKANNNFKF